MNIGVNLFGPAKKLYQDFAKTMQRLQDIGFTSVETCVVFGDEDRLRRNFPPEIREQMTMMSGGIWHQSEAAAKIAAFRQHGFIIRSSHVMTDTSSPERFLAVLPAVKTFGVENGLQYFVISLMKNLEGTKEFIPALNQFAAELAKAGIQLAYHNHEVECTEEDGTTPLDYMLEHCPLLKLELDVGWAKFAGASAPDLMQKYHDRITMLHFKDVRADASPANRATCFTAVGEGSIPLAEIMALAPTCQLDEHGLIIDQDDSPGDIPDDLARGFRNISQS